MKHRHTEDPEYISKLRVIENRIFSSQESYFSYAGYPLYQGLI